MTSPRQTLAALLVGTLAACGGGQAAPAGPTPTPAVHQLAMLQERGQLDPARLVCAAEAAAPVAADFERAAESYAREQRWDAVALAHGWAIDAILAVHEAHDIRVGSGQGVVAWTDEDAALLTAYAEARAGVATGEPIDTDTRDLITSTEAERPEIMEAYARLLLGTYRDVDLSCAAPDA